MVMFRLRAARLVGILLGISISSTAQFTPAPNPPFPFPVSSPIALAVGYFNADTLPDLAVANQIDGTVTLILSNGAGGYTAKPPIPVGTYPSAIAVADFNKDGNQDVAVVNQGDGTVTILLGDGQGNMTFHGTYMAGNSPNSIAVADFNLDTNPDLAITALDGNQVAVLKGDGSGGFTPFPHSPFAVGNRPSSVAAADFNGDGFPDLAVTNEIDNTVSVLEGDGTGNFSPFAASPFTVGSNPFFIAAKDFNGDGFLDLAIANLTSNNVTVLLGNGSGGFSPSSSGPFAVGSMPVSMVVADFNGDYIPDLAVANSGSNNVTVLLGNGTGGFKGAPGSPYSVPNTTKPSSIGLGDFNQDGRLDLAVANLGSNDVSVLLNGFTVPAVMVSAASFSSTAPVSPESMVSIFANDSASMPVLAPAVSVIDQLPQCLEGISIAITDFSGAKNMMYLLYAGPTVINAVVPPGVATGAASFAVSTSSAADCSTPPTGVAQKGSATVAAVAPALFSINISGKGAATGEILDLVTGATQSLYSCPATGPCALSPVDVSQGTSSLVLYGTGIRTRATLSSVTVTVGTQTLPAFYAGASSDVPLVDQVNVALPASLAGSGTVYVSVSIAGTTSNQVTLEIQ